MIGINRLAKGNKTLGTLAGGIMGWFAWSRPFMALAALGIGSEYLERKREAEAMAEARKAALLTGTVNPACRDPHSAECHDAVKSAAVQAGTAAMRRPGRLRLIFAWLFALGTLSNAAAGHWQDAMICGVLFLPAAWPYLPRLRRADEVVKMPD